MSVPERAPLRFKVFYGDGSSYTDQDGPPELAPKNNVMAVSVECRVHGRIVCNASDFYIYDLFDGEMSWQGVDQYGFWDYLTRPGAKVVLMGRTMGNVEYAKVLGKALDDDYLPRKTGSFRSERTAE